MTNAMKRHPETGAELLLFTKPFSPPGDGEFVWVDDEGLEYPATREELQTLGFLSPVAGSRQPQHRAG